MSILYGDKLCYSKGGKDILRDVSLEVKEGELVGLIGHNGAGKSTLIKIFLGLIKADSGVVQILGKEPGTNLLEVGYLPENINFYDSMTIEEQLIYFARLKRVDLGRVDELIKDLGIAEVRRTKLRNCSKGQRQRLGLAQALLSQPKILFLDEPTVGLDPEATALMYQELISLKEQGCTIVVCTHELSLLEDFVDDAIVLAQGEKKAQGSLETLRRIAQLKAIITFDGEFDVIKAHPSLSPYVNGETLAVSSNKLSDVIKILTHEMGMYDFHIKEPGLLEIYSKLVGKHIRSQ